jgi:hypothetical protein
VLECSTTWFGKGITDLESEKKDLHPLSQGVHFCKTAGSLRRSSKMFLLPDGTRNVDVCKFPLSDFWAGATQIVNDKGKAHGSALPKGSPVCRRLSDLGNLLLAEDGSNATYAPIVGKESQIYQG